MNRFWHGGRLELESEAALPPPIAHQVRRVLRLRPGDQLTLIGADRTEYRCELIEAGSRDAVVRVMESLCPEVEYALRLTVAISLIKGEKPDWVVQKLTEVGVAEIIWMTSRRGVVEPATDRWPARLERYRRIATEAVEQSGRLQIPEVRGPIPLEACLTLEREVRLICDPGAHFPASCEEWRGVGSALLLVGPEGGFTADELHLARSLGVRPLSLGKTVLRAETAAVVGASSVLLAADRPPVGCGGIPRAEAQPS